MKVDGEVGGKLLAALEKVQQGGFIEFHSPLPGLTGELVALKLVSSKEVNDKQKTWTFEAYWFDVYIGEAKADLIGSDLNFTVTK